MSIDQAQVINTDSTIAVIEVGIPGPVGDVTSDLECLHDETKNNSEIAVKAKNDAQESAKKAQDVVSGIRTIEAKVYDPDKNYSYPELAISTIDGGTYRCIRNSHGEEPALSDKWVEVAMVISEAFEPDENGDLMPRVYPRTSQRWDLDEKGQIMPL